MERYIVFDVETPNYRNNRMSAIGLTVIENGRITDSFATLVNPETHFDRFNISLTGITPAMAAEAPTFPELWTELRPLMAGGLLIAHNAPFDMRVLGHCLRDYHLPAAPSARYACTCRMGKRCYPHLPNHRLNTLCDHLRIPLDHHRADSDSRACALLLLNYLEAGLEVRPFIRTYDFRQMRTLRG